MIRPVRIRFDEAGTSLIIALVFVFAVGLVTAALVTFVGDDLLNSHNLKAQRSVEYAADGAADMAVQSVRYAYDTYQTPGDCLPDGLTSWTIDGVAMTVYCTNQTYDATGDPTRVVNFYACDTTTCGSGNAIVWAQVDFDDYPYPSGSISCSQTSSSTCGSGMTIADWVVETGNN